MPALADDLALALDPVLLCERQGLQPDPWQRDVLRSRAPRLLLNCSRQAGKSTVTSILAVHAAVYEPESLVLLLSPSLRQSQELYRKCQATYRALDAAAQGMDRGRAAPFGHGSIPRPDTYTQLELGLDNRSRIVCLPAKEATVRGYSGVRLLVVDEASRVSDGLYYSVTPMLAVSGGRLVALSTPWGRRGWWYEAWQSGERWERYSVPAAACPRIPRAFLEEERRALPAMVFAAEYECRFTDLIGGVFPSDLVVAAGRDDLAPLFDMPPVDDEDDGPEPLFGIMEG